MSALPMLNRWPRALCVVTLLMCAGAAQLCAAESLYREENFRPLTADNKAFRVGDVLTVQVFENSSATTSADTGTNRKNNVSAQASTATTRGPQLSVGISSDFDGGGKTQRANKLLATITVTVRELLPNGDLRVEGEQMLTVNDELQKVTLDGRVRPVDISDGNIVLSTRLADARISYVGEGDVSERSRRPWWRKLLDWGGL